MIELIEVKAEHRELLWNVYQKYLYEMTNYDDNEMDETGNYHYGYFDAYFTEPERTALFIYADKLLEGFAMINPYSYINEHPDHILAEFTIFPMYRKKHIGKGAAELILKAYGGRREIKCNEKNIGAKVLWNKVTDSYHPVKHKYSNDKTVNPACSTPISIPPAPEKREIADNLSLMLGSFDKYLAVPALAHKF